MSDKPKTTELVVVKKMRPRRNAFPKMNGDYKQYHMVSSPISANPISSEDQVVYSSFMSPFIPLNNTSTEHQLSIQGSNHQMYRFKEVSVHLRSVAPDSVAGYSISVVMWRDSVEPPSKIDLNTLSQADHHTLIGPHQSGGVRASENVLNTTGNLKRCDPSTGSVGFSRSGFLVVVLHGEPTNSYTGQRYTGPLFQLDFQVVARFVTWSPGNTDSKIRRQVARERLSFKNESGSLSLQSPTALGFFAGENSASQPSLTIGQVLLNVADAAASALPFPFNLLAKAGIFFVRKVTGSNGQDNLLVYATEQDARDNRPIPYVGNDLSLGESAYQLTDVSVINKDAIATFSGNGRGQPNALSTGINTIILAEASEVSPWTGEGKTGFFFTAKAGTLINANGVMGVFNSDRVITKDGHVMDPTKLPWGGDGTGLAMDGFALIPGDTSISRISFTRPCVLFQGSYFFFINRTCDPTKGITMTFAIDDQSGTQLAPAGDQVDGFIDGFSFSPSLNIGSKKKHHSFDSDCAICKNACELRTLKHTKERCLRCQQKYKLDVIPDCITAEYEED